MREVNLFDYFYTDEGIFYISSSDSHLEDTVIANPVYIEDSSGDRTFNGESYSKTPRDANKVDGIETSHLSDTASNVPREDIEELRKPFEREEHLKT
jgi:predicted nucleotidyltransferase